MPAWPGWRDSLNPLAGKCLWNAFSVKYAARSQILDRTVSLRFLGIILKVLRLEVSVYNVSTSFKQLLSQLCPRIRPLESTRVQYNSVLAEAGVLVPEFSRLNSGTETPTSDVRVRVQTVENKCERV